MRERLHTVVSFILHQCCQLKEEEELQKGMGICGQKKAPFLLEEIKDVPLHTIAFSLPKVKHKSSF